MAPPTRGGAYERRGRIYLRVTVDAGKRRAVAVPWCADLEVAIERAHVVQALVDRLRAAGHDELVPKVVAVARDKDATKLEAMGRAIDGLLGGELVKVAPKRSGVLTFQVFAERWTGGELHRDYPDHVRAKRSADDDVFRLAKHVYPEIGPRELASLTLDDALAVMRKLPPELSPASRRHVAQLLSKVFTLAVYPCRVLAVSPLPRGFLPKLRKQKAKAALFPNEEAQLLAARTVPLPNRMLYGFLAREGMRSSEALRMTWEDLNLDHGMVRLDANKTDDPRAWALDSGTAEALRRWRALRGKVADTSTVFEQVENRGHLADTFRAHLREAKVTRAELYEDSPSRRPIRLHDLRATMTTVALASGKTEAWVTARTGHRSSMQVSGYRRLAQAFADVGAASLANMADTVPELSKEAAADAAARVGKRRAPTAKKSKTSREPG